MSHDSRIKNLLFAELLIESLYELTADQISEPDRHWYSPDRHWYCYLWNCCHFINSKGFYALFECLSSRGCLDVCFGSDCAILNS